jgi:DNA modification methylase
MNINRVWEMPNSRTFKIKCIRNIILKYVKNDMIILDPFANEMSIKNSLINSKYISNDLDTDYDCNYNLDAEDFLKTFENKSVDMLLFDPPYSGRQVSECYKKLEKTITMHDTNSGFLTKFKKEISRVVKEDGIVVTCGWNSNGIGKKYGFEIIEILMVAHGSSHNDTIVTIEKKSKSIF